MNYLRKIKYGKIAVVIFLTVLIWVWADLALDEILPDRPATLVVDESANPKLWVSFSQALSADIKITLSGPHAAIADVSRKLRKGEGIEFNFDAAQEKMDKPGDFSLSLLAFLQKDKETRRLGLKIESCEPEILDVNVVELVEKSLTVECFNEDGIPLEVKSIEPKKVDMFVPEDRRTARVQLTRREREQARLSAVEKTPYVVLAAGQIREAATAVKIKMSPEEDRLSDYTITKTTLSVALSPTLLGEYSVEVTNLPQLLGPIAIRATPEAKRTYELQPLPLMTLYIFDVDAKKGAEEQRKAVVYNFPPEFVRKDEIKLKNPQQSAEAKFKLIPLSSAEAPAGGVD
ncbi:hypothetical protein ES703_13320 [subsurface metagenome]